MKLYTLISFVFIVALSLIPPIEIVLRNPQSPYWLWMVVAAGFFGVFTLFIKTDPFVKIIAIFGFINCFFSAAPYISFTSYCSLILCCYFYICCCRIEKWDLIFKAAQSVLLLNVILIVLEFMHRDSLMNFGKDGQSFGVLGQHMQMGSFAVVISALLLSFSKFNILFPILAAWFCKSSWTFIVSGLGLFVYLFSVNKNLAASVLILFVFVFSVWDCGNHKIQSNFDNANGRVLVWKKSLALADKHPWIGWGIGTYKELFPPLSRIKSIPWKTAHNFISQLVFEIGYPFTACLILALVWLGLTLLSRNLWLHLAGLSMITTDALVHFPDRMIQTVPLIIVFLAYTKVTLTRSL